MLNLVLFGPPGAGKGTQSKKLLDKYSLIHLSTGDLLRDEISRGTELGQKAKSIMDKGDLVSDEIVIGMIESKLSANPNANGFIFDGFPRTIAQARALDELLDKHKTGITMMLALEVDNNELIQRLILRGKESGRPDDSNEDIIRNRIHEYNNKTAPLKQYYSGQGKYNSVYGMGDVNQIFELLCAVIENKTRTKKQEADGIATVADISFDPEPADNFKPLPKAEVKPEIKAHSEEKTAKPTANVIKEKPAEKIKSTQEKPKKQAKRLEKKAVKGKSKKSPAKSKAAKPAKSNKAKSKKPAKKVAKSKQVKKSAKKAVKKSTKKTAKKVSVKKSPKKAAPKNATSKKKNTSNKKRKR